MMSISIKKCLTLFFQLPNPRKIYQTAGEFIRHQQAKQQYDYNRHHQVSTNIKPGQKVLLKNQRREDRKVGNFFIQMA